MSATGCTILGSALLTLFLAGYLAQRYLPPPKPKIVGIDLGTTFSCIGAYQAGSGEVKVLEDKLGHKCIPSIVAFTGKDILVGYAAAEQAEHNPQNTIYDAKRFIGKGFTMDDLQKEVARYPFKMVISEDGMIRYQVHHDDENRNKKELTPEVIGSHILRQLKDTAERRLEAKVHRAVISVPAEFDEQQRNYTRQAAELAGFDVLRVITEPTAAALAYGLHKKSGIRNVLVVDLGGGTLDVSLLNIQGGMFLTQAIAGNNHLGGQDFNQRLLTHVLQQITVQFHRQLTDPEDMQALRLAVEDVKQNLTYHDTATLTLHIRSFHGKLSSSADPIHYKLDIDRRTFEKLNDDLFEKVLEPIGRVLEATELPREDVDEIVLVGGSTRIPRVRRLIQVYFNKVPNTSIEPELAVVMGSSLQAGVIGGMWPLAVSAIEQRSPVLKKIHVQ